MLLEALLFVIFTALVLHNNGVQTYIHFEAYPLFKYVGKPEYAEYLNQYEQRLTVPLLAPYGLTLLTNIALIFIRPDGVSLVGIILALLLNISMAGISIRVATPVYTRLKESGFSEETFKELMKINLIRLVVTTVISLIVCGLLVGVMS